MYFLSALRRPLGIDDEIKFVESNVEACNDGINELPDYNILFQIKLITWFLHSLNTHNFANMTSVVMYVRVMINICAYNSNNLELSIYNFKKPSPHKAVSS